MTLTQNQIDRLSNDIQKYAGSETINVELVHNTIYSYTSELGAYRIHAKYNNTSKGRVLFSENLNTWVFALDL